MLQSLRDCADAPIGRDLSPAGWARSIAGNLAVTAASALLFRTGYQQLVVRRGLSVGVVAAGWAAAVTLITAGLFVYYVYIVDSGRGSSGGDNKGREGRFVLPILCAFSNEQPM